MSIFLCPVCGKPLCEEEKLYVCENRHSFDKAKEGYVNLVMQGGSHGDDRDMIVARREFLNKGYYSHFANTICTAVKEVVKDADIILDSGCGEGYYTEKLHPLIPDSAEIYGIDISKYALKYAGKALKKYGTRLAAASAYKLPLPDKSINIIIDIFSPLALAEFRRVLCDNGYLILGIADENHLIELKQAVYDTPYKNELSDYALDGFELIKELSCAEKITLKSNEDIKNLFEMTPYAHKTSHEDIIKLERLSTLKVSAEFKVLIYGNL